MDFNSVIFRQSIIDNVRIYMKEMYLSDYEFKLNDIEKWEIKWDDGLLYSGQREILYFHFQLSKLNNELIFIEKGNNFILKKR